MNASMIVSAVSMQAAQQKLDTVAHNLANLNTPGFKRREASFQDILTNTIIQEPGFEKAGRKTPLGLPVGWGAKVGQTSVSLVQGPLVTTNRDLDVAIEGNGLFQVEWIDTDANGGAQPRRAWTRDGSFQLVPVEGDPDRMQLVTSRGEFVLDSGGNRIYVPSNARVHISEEGVLTFYHKATHERLPADGDPIRLSVGRVVRPHLLQNIGDNLIAVDEAAGAIRPDAFDPADGSDAVRLRQGMLEQSNVNFGDEMTELMIAQRAFELNSRAFASAEQLMGLAVSIRA
ncbi:flagellar hook-basal body protein [Paenibacillus thermoaerophilus]|uniref:Flagellar hook-basal body protein n=1 Tax=Paenibacillus thermoaerophilus TaxID=1215385 RepID=A0ABW2V4W5_9BACL|nr:flagellar hook-basal body protein [Paenibacillus thermoaerophilus]TMV12503.1 flagellar hook-basal body protein [Paenibacillus thermoaerophilus]